MAVLDGLSDDNLDLRTSVVEDVDNLYSFNDKMQQLRQRQQAQQDLLQNMVLLQQLRSSWRLSQLRGSNSEYSAKSESLPQLTVFLMKADPIESDVRLQVDQEIQDMKPLHDEPDFDATYGFGGTGELCIYNKLKDRSIKENDKCMIG